MRLAATAAGIRSKSSADGRCFSMSDVFLHILRLPDIPVIALVCCRRYGNENADHGRPASADSDVRWFVQGFVRMFRRRLIHPTPMRVSLRLQLGMGSCWSLRVAVRSGLRRAQ